MQTRLSSKGQVVLPRPVRRKLGLRPGDPLAVSVQGRQIVLTPQAPHRMRPRIATDPLSGLPVLTAGPDAPTLTSREVATILAEFPRNTSSTSTPSSPSDSSNMSFTSA